MLTAESSKRSTRNLEGLILGKFAPWNCTVSAHGILHECICHFVVDDYEGLSTCYNKERPSAKHSRSTFYTSHLRTSVFISSSLSRPTDAFLQPRAAMILAGKAMALHKSDKYDLQVSQKRPTQTLQPNVQYTLMLAVFYSSANLRFESCSSSWLRASPLCRAIDRTLRLDAIEIQSQSHCHHCSHYWQLSSRTARSVYHQASLHIWSRRQTARLLPSMRVDNATTYLVASVLAYHR